MDLSYTGVYLFFFQIQRRRSLKVLGRTFVQEFTKIAEINRHPFLPRHGQFSLPTLASFTISVSLPLVDYVCNLEATCRISRATRAWT